MWSSNNFNALHGLVLGSVVESSVCGVSGREERFIDLDFAKVGVFNQSKKMF